MPQTFVLITGGNRGIGGSLVARFLAQPNHLHCHRRQPRPLEPQLQSPSNLPKGAQTHLIVIKYDASVEEDAASLVIHLNEKHALNHLDIVIPNAGIMAKFPQVKDAKRADVLEHFQANAFSVVSLYQATRDLLQKSSREPIFAPIGSGAEPLSNQPPVPNATYGPSKVLLNWYTVKTNTEDDWLNSSLLQPGLVNTDRVAAIARQLQLPPEAMDPLDDVCDGLFNVPSSATKEEVGGKSVSPAGDILPW